jgi:hypothetical protein
MSVSDIGLLSQCAEFTLSHSQSGSENIIKELQSGGRTTLVTGLRMLRLQGMILAVGMFSLFESLLQSNMGWQQPFDQLDKHLKQFNKNDLAQTFCDYRKAINVLKHGRGPSYEQLLAKANDLEFSIKTSGDHFFCEGDVSEVDVLIDVDHKFVRRCAALIQEVSKIIGSNDRNWNA